MIRTKCLICDSSNLNKIIDLGSHPFADTFIPISKIGDPDMIYPLVCDLCSDCGHVQTRYETDPVKRYSQIDYSYTSSNSTFSRNHWDSYFKEVHQSTQLQKGMLVVEVGSNDGYLIEHFLKSGYRTLGVDPSPYMANLANARGVETIVSLFNEKTADAILSKYGPVNLIIANNVFNHSDNPLDFAKSVAKILGPRGSFVFEQPYWFETIKSGKFDQIYHEHVSYFTVKSVNELLSKVGMVISRVEIVDYHGGSLRIIAEKKEDCPKILSETKQLIENEEKFGLFNPNMYSEFMHKLHWQRNEFLQKICKLKQEGNSIVAVGAAAKANTFLNFYKLDNSFIDYVTDASPHKQNKYTPATRIPIVGDEIFSKYDAVYALILSWNIAPQLKEKLSPINKNINFISPDK